jgi:hypothetical protein
MNTTNAVALTGLLVVAGRWSAGKPLDIRVAVGVGGVALGLSALSSADEGLAGKFAVLILVTAIFAYGPWIADKAGLIHLTEHQKRILNGKVTS